MQRPATVELSRDRQWRDRLRSYRVYVDGIRVARIRAGQTITLPVDTGEHRLQVRIDWCRSPVLAIAAGRDAIRLRCGNAGVSPLTREGYLYLETERT